jgi:hypothetical protein
MQSTVESVRDLHENGKRFLEGVLGQRLHDNDQVFIMVLSSGSEPDESARARARTSLEATFQKTAAYAAQHGVSDDEIDSAIHEAIEQIRKRSD